jgi:hypothetical protein
VLAGLLVEPRLGVQEVASGSPGVCRATRDLVAPEVLSRDPAVRERLLELLGGLLIQPRRRLEGVAHVAGNSSGQGNGFGFSKPAYASLGLLVSSVTPAPCLSATSSTG